MLKKTMIKIMLPLAGFIIPVMCLGAPIYPNGGLGVNHNSYYAYSLHVPKGKTVQFIYRYSADKENQVMIYNVREDKSIKTLNNGHGNKHHTNNLFSQTMRVKYLITSYSKDCWVGRRNCASRNWVQEPIRVDVRNKTVYFDDSCDPVAGRHCSYDDASVSWRFIN